MNKEDYIHSMRERYFSMRKWRTIDQYDQLLGISLRDIANHALTSAHGFHWVDLCCGSFLTGKQAA